MSDYDDDFDPYEDLMDLAGDEPLPNLEDPATPGPPPPSSPLLTGLIVGLLLVVLSIAAFQLIGNDEPQATASDTTAAPEGTDGGTSGATSTTEPGDTSESTTSTTEAANTLPEFEAVGEPIPVEDLTLAVDAIGPVQMGSAARRSIGRLVASLGPPDADSGAVVSDGSSGACEGDTERLVRWGPLIAVVIIDDDGSQTFAGYRLDIDNGGFTSVANQLETLSGVSLGHSVAHLKRTYEDFDLDFSDDPDLGTIFELKSTNSGNLLLWGRVSSADDSGFVQGIYSPQACGRFSL